MRLTGFVPIFLLLLATAALADPPSPCVPPVLGQVHIVEETAGFSVDIEYPALCSLAATRIIRDHVTRLLADFKLVFPEHDLTEYRYKHELTVDFSVWITDNRRLASVKLDVNHFTGGAHPNHYPETMIFDLTNGKLLQIGDIFTSPEVALLKLAPSIRTTLNTSLGDMTLPDMVESGTTATLQNYEDFILYKEGMAFFFAPYQVGPYAAGEQVVTVPWERLDPLLKENFRNLMQR